MEHVPPGGSADILHPPIDLPRTLVNVGTLAALAILVAVTVARVLSGGSALPALTYASLAGIEILWLVGHAILISSQE